MGESWRLKLRAIKVEDGGAASQFDFGVQLATLPSGCTEDEFVDCGEKFVREVAATLADAGMLKRGAP